MSSVLAAAVPLQTHSAVAASAAHVSPVHAALAAVAAVASPPATPADAVARPIVLAKVTQANSPVAAAAIVAAAGAHIVAGAGMPGTLALPAASLNTRAYSTPGLGQFYSRQAMPAVSPSVALGSSQGASSSTSAGVLLQSQLSASMLRSKNLPLVLQSLPELVSVQSLQQTAISSLQATADMFDSLLTPGGSSAASGSSSSHASMHALNTAGIHSARGAMPSMRMQAPTSLAGKPLHSPMQQHLQVARSPAPSPLAVPSPAANASPAAAAAAAAAAALRGAKSPYAARSPNVFIGASPANRITPTAGAPPFHAVPRSKGPVLSARRGQLNGLPPLARVLSPSYTTAVGSPPLSSPPLSALPMHSPPTSTPSTAQQTSPASSPASAGATGPTLLAYVVVTSPTASITSPVAPFQPHNLPQLATSPSLAHTPAASAVKSHVQASAHPTPASHLHTLSMPVMDATTLAALGVLHANSNPSSPQPGPSSPQEALLHAMLTQTEHQRASLLQGEAQVISPSSQPSLKTGLSITLNASSPHAQSTPQSGSGHSTPSGRSSCSTRSVVRSPGSSPPPQEKPAWAMRLTRSLVTDEDGTPSGGSGPTNRLGLSLDSTGSNSSSSSGSHRGHANMSLSLPCGDIVLDRAQSYVVREHTVVVGSYRINESGLFSTVPPPSTHSSHASIDLFSTRSGLDEGNEAYENGDAYDDDDDGGEAGEGDDDGVPPSNDGQQCAVLDEQTLLQHARDSEQHSNDVAASHDHSAETSSYALSVVNETGETVSSGSKSNATSPASKHAARQARMRRGRRGTMPAALASHEVLPHHHHPHAASLGAGARRRSRVSQHSTAPQAMSLSKDDLVELEIIGRGQNGNVRKAVHLPTLTRVALKTMDIYEKSTRHQLLHELHAFSGLNSPYLISFLGAYHDSGMIFLASEYMDCGSLSHFIHRQGGRIRDERLLKHISAQTLQGLAYLHSQARIHRDIKGDNILLNRMGQVKIGDFGLMTKVDPDHPVCAEFMGTLAYLSPERLASAEYSYAADVWSLGITLILASTGQLPVQGADFWDFMSAMDKQAPSLQATIDTIARGGYSKRVSDGSKKSDNVAASLGLCEIPVEDASGADVPDEPLEFSADFHDFIARMLELDPAVRWSAQQLLQHPFLTDVTDTTTTHESAWEHHDVRESNTRDLDVILDILANRQIHKLANEESRRQRSKDGEVAPEEFLQGRTPGHAVAPSMVFPDPVAPSVQTAPTPAAAPISEDSSAFPPSLHLRTTASPSLGSRASGLDSAHSVSSDGPISNTSDASSSVSSVFSPESVSSVRSTDSSFSSSGLQLPSSTHLHSSSSSTSMFSPLSSSMSTASPSVQSGSFSGSTQGPSSSPYPATPFSASMFGSPPPMAGHGSFVSPSPDPPSSQTNANAAHDGAGEFVLPASTGGFDAAFVLPAAPSDFSVGGSDSHLRARDANAGLGEPIFLTQEHCTLPSAPIFAHEQQHQQQEQHHEQPQQQQEQAQAQQHEQPDQHQSESESSDASSAFSRTTDGELMSTSVEILAVVTQLDASRLAVLSAQYSLPCDDIQARYSQVQLNLFDSLAAQQDAQQMIDESSSIIGDKTDELVAEKRSPVVAALSHEVPPPTHHLLVNA